MVFMVSASAVTNIRRLRLWKRSVCNFQVCIQVVSLTSTHLMPIDLMRKLTEFSRHLGQEQNLH